MRREPKQLLEKALNSLIFSIEVFNRPNNQGRTETVLMFLDHAFEMMLKSAILHQGGKIREKRSAQTIGFDSCVRKALSEGGIRFINEEQAITLQIINGLRDAAQHHLLEISEQQLYLHAQSGVTLFSDILEGVFDNHLSDYLPERVLPISSQPPTSIEMIMRNEVEQIRKLLQPRKRRMLDARAKAKGLVILNKTVEGSKQQPSMAEIDSILRKVKARTSWEDIFPGVAALRLDVEQGVPLNLRIMRKGQGVPISLVPEGTPGAAVVAVKRVNELGYYNLGLNQLAKQVELTSPRALAVVRALRLQNNKEYYSEFRIGKSLFKRYSQRAAERIKQELPNLDMAAVWSRYRPGR